jgi:anti-sigma regulatory factor (Ser/Thr protein kinase)
MTPTAIKTSYLITFVVLSAPESVRMARFHVLAALSYHRLNDCADEICIIASELVTNAVQHASAGPDATIGVQLLRVHDPDAVCVVVSDSSSDPPIKRDAPFGSERGRGLHIVEALSAHWAWHLEAGGKAVFAIVAREEQPS